LRDQVEALPFHTTRGWKRVYEYLDRAAVLELVDEGSLLDSPRFRAAVDEVFAAPGEFGPAKGYYGGDTDHFIDMLRAALRGME
jgi:hypothetical protein